MPTDDTRLFADESRLFVLRLGILGILTLSLFCAPILDVDAMYTADPPLPLVIDLPRYFLFSLTFFYLSARSTRGLSYFAWNILILVLIND